MVRHHEQDSFGEARSWRMVVHHAREALDPDETLLATSDREPPVRAPTDEELERLVRLCRLVEQEGSALALPAGGAHELIGRLAGELLLWRHSHPNELLG